MKRCIVSADDFALNGAVDDAILALIDAGALTATSCLTRSPRWPAAARRLRSVAHGRADVGVHLDLTEFDRAAPNHAALVLACATRGIDARRLHALLKTQFERFEEAYGGAPDYVDGHRHVHQLPVVRDVLVGLLAERYGQQLPWVRVSRAGAGTGWKAGLIGALGSAGLVARCLAAGVPHSRRLHGIYDFNGDGSSYQARLASWLGAAGDGDALMCHPALRAEPGDPIGAAREIEFAALSSAGWTDCLVAHGVEASRGSRCLRA